MRLTKTKLYINKDDYTFRVEDNLLKYTTKVNIQNDQKIDDFTIDKGLNYSNLYINNQSGNNIENKLQINNNGLSYSIINSTNNTEIVSNLSWKEEDNTIGLYGSITGTDKFPVIKGFALYDKENHEILYSDLERLVSGDYIPNIGNVQNLDFSITRNNFAFISKDSKFIINNGIFSFASDDEFSPELKISIGSIEFKPYIHNNSCIFDISSKEGNTSVLKYIYNNTDYITPTLLSDFTGDINIYNTGDIILNPTGNNKKLYYGIKSDNNEVVIKNDLTGYIPNAGNNIENSFNLSRNSITLSGAGGINLRGYNSNISIDDFEDSNATIYINGLERTIIFGNDGKIDLQNSVEITSGTTYDETINDYVPHDITLNSAKDIILNAAEEQKVYYVHNSAEPTADNEIITVGTVSGNYIPNAGNNTDDNLVIQRNSFKLNAANGFHVEAPWSGGVALGDPYLYDGLFVNESITRIKTRNLDFQGTEDAYFHNSRDIILRAGRNVNFDGSGSVSITPQGNVTINPTGTVSVKGYIPNAGNSDNILDFTLSRKSIALKSKDLITLSTDTEDVYFSINSSQFNVSMQDAIDISSISGDITLNTSENKKAYYVKNNATPTDDDEIATKGDIANIDLSNYVLKTDFEDLLEKYNDLCERLNEFLEETGELEERINKLYTTNTDTVTLYFLQSEKDAITIDWGDGNTETSGGTLIYDGNNSEDRIITHNYSENGEYIIKLTRNSEHLIEIYTEDSSARMNNIAKIELYDIEVASGMSLWEDSDLTEIFYDLPLNHYHFINANNVTKITLGNNSSINEGSYYFPESLTSLTINENSNNEIDNEILEDCPNTEELYLVSSTVFTTLGDDWELATYDEDPLENLQNLTIYVPMELVNTYKAATGWEKYASIIVGY